MDLALASLALLLLLLPGIGIRLTYVRRDGLSRLGESSLAAEIVVAVVLSLLFQIPAWFIAEHVMGLDFRIDLFTSFISDDKQLYENSEGDIERFLLYALGSFIIGLGTGRALQMVMRRTRYGSTGIFAISGEWDLIFSGISAEAEDNDTISAVVVDVLCPMGEDRVIYTGVLNSYYVNDKGLLERLVLDQVARTTVKTLDAMPEKTPEAYDKAYRPIAGDSFVIYSSTISNINVTFVHLREEDVPELTDADIENTPPLSANDIGTTAPKSGRP